MSIMEVLDIECIEILKMSIKSRLIVFGLSIILNVVIGDHISLDAYNNGLTTKHTTHTTSSDELVYEVLNGLNRWDSQYFISIAYNGYKSEQFLAFFPIFPFTIKLMAQPINYLLSKAFELSYVSSLMITAFLINFFSFILCSIVLYKLSMKLFNNFELSYCAVYWFCYNPCSIFFSSFYSESMFSLFTFTALLFTAKSQPFIASILFAFTTGIRSNGLISIGFLLYLHFDSMVKAIKYNNTYPYRLLMIILVQTLFEVCVCLLPFIGYQYYSYKLFCNNAHNDNSEWCSSLFPLSYSYVQSKYWSVGFLKYYQFKQIPNFLLALPVICFSLCTAYHYLHANRKLIKTVGIIMNKHFIGYKHISYNSLTSNPFCFVYVIHLLCLVLFCTLFIHIQVTTRLLLSSSPVLYWAMASIHTDVRHKSIQYNTYNTNTIKLVTIWFYSYFLIGILLHANAYPWT